jgi:hypothetical protein
MPSFAEFAELHRVAAIAQVRLDDSLAEFDVDGFFVDLYVVGSGTVIE